MERSVTDREVSKLLLRACHDLRSSARAVRIHAELFSKDGMATQGPDLEQRIGFLVEGSRKIDSLLDGLSAYSVALQTDAESFQTVRLGVLLRAAIAKLGKELQRCGGEVSYGELPAVSCNPDRLIQVFEYLLRNAVLYRDSAPPRIRIESTARPDTWLISVRDNGAGIGKESLESIFEPFERQAARERCGPGLGLAICRAIVERHGGAIWAESEPGQGSTFNFTLPR